MGTDRPPAEDARESPASAADSLETFSKNHTIIQSNKLVLTLLRSHCSKEWDLPALLLVLRFGPEAGLSKIQNVRE